MVARETVQRLIQLAGRTYADEAGIRLADRPMPLFQLLVLCMLAAKPIGADVAATAAHEVFATGARTPKTVLRTPRADIIEAFRRAGYARYDESSASRLVALAESTIEKYDGDLRMLGRRCHGDADELRRALTEFEGVGEVAAGIFMREVQDTWTWVRPCLDERAVAGARSLKLPTTPARLGTLAPGRNARLAAALVRVSTDDQLRAQLLG